MARILVTGATGMLGSNLASRLVASGHDVSVLIRRGSSHPFLERLTIDTHYGDIRDADSVDRAVDGAEYVFHAAGQIAHSKWKRSELTEIHVDGTRNVLESSLRRGVRKVIVTSSTSAVGIPRENEIANEENDFLPEYQKIAYMSTKRAAEQLALSYARKGLDVVAVCPSSMYGRGDVKGNMCELMRNIRQQRIPFAPAGGSSVVSVSDSVNGHILAMERGRSGERYILSNENLKNIELMNRIAELLGVRRVTKTIPAVLMPMLTMAARVAENVFRSERFTPELMMFSAKDRFYNSQKARSELGWAPAQTIHQSLVEAISFYERYDLL